MDEVTNEIKAKMFSHYLGQKFILPNEDNGKQKFDLRGCSIENIQESHKWASAILILKPLSAISNEDAIQVGTSVMGKYKPLENGKAFIKQIINKESMALDFHPLSTLSAFQFLRSKGYDLPHYLLGDKTLHECNLATYEND